MTQLEVNSLIQNRYLLVQPLGRDGAAEAYLAIDQKLGNAVALKRTAFDDDTALGAAFAREATVLSRLVHPILPKVLDHFSENGSHFIVMEHISGDDMDKRLEDAQKPFPLSWAMFWADQLLDALTYLHSHEPPIIHRDIKPVNLKLTAENHIVLLDLGMTGGPVPSSGPGEASPFVSPEHMRGTGSDARSDIYSLSATLYQFLANIRPADAAVREQTIKAGADPLRPLNLVNPEVSQAIADVVTRGMALKPEDRYATAAEMQRTLRRAFSTAASDAQTVAMSGSVVAEVLGNAATPADPGEVSTKTSFPVESFSSGVTVPNFPKPAEKAPGSKTQVMSADELLAEGVEEEQPTVLISAPAAATAATPPAAAVKPPLQPAPKPAAPSAGGSSKLGWVLGGAAALILILGVGAVGAWYAYANYFAGAVPTPSPTPVQAAVPSPTPATVAELPVTQITPEEPANLEPEPSPTKTTGTAPVGPGKPATAPGKPAAPARTPGQAKPAAKPKQTDDRTVILQ